MYITKEPHKLRSGFKTVKFRWWFKNGEKKSQKQAVIMNPDQMLKARKDFIEAHPDGKVLIKDFTK